MSAASTQSQIPIVNNLQVLRGTAAIMIVCYHLGSLFARLGFVAFGSAGVDLFFVLSGVVMVITTRRRNVTPLGFLSRRVARIVPLYWLLTLCVFAYATTSHHVPGFASRGPLDLLRSLLFVPYRNSNNLFEPLLPVGWTLNFEMLFYVLFAAALLIPKRTSSVLILCAVIVAIPIIAPLTHPSASSPLNLYDWPIIIDFAFGMLLGLLASIFPDSKPSKGMIWVASFVAILVWLLLMFQPDKNANAVRLLWAGLPAFALLGIVMALEKWGVKFENRLLLAVGDASYSLYLVHSFVTRLAEAWVHRQDPGPVVCALVIVAAIVIACAISLAIYKFVEKPMTTYARRLLVRGS